MRYGSLAERLRPVPSPAGAPPAALGSAVLTVLLLLAVGGGSASAAPASGPVTLSAPFAHTTHEFDHTVGVSGCGAARSPKPTFSLHTGTGSLIDSTRVGAGCTIGPAGDSASASNGATATIRLPRLSGRHTIYVNWTVRATASFNITLGTCTLHGTSYNTGCDQEAEIIFNGEAVIADYTASQDYPANSSWAGYENTTYRDNGVLANYTSPGPVNQSFTFSTNATYVFTDAFHGGSVYYLDTSVFGYARVLYTVNNAVLSTDGPARASVNASGSTGGFALVSVTIL